MCNVSGSFFLTVVSLGFMPGKSRGPRSLVGYNPWVRKESDTTEQLLCVCVCVCVYHFDYLGMHC